jgi:putative spermidine/putrescine transport system permease protein
VRRGAAFAAFALPAGIVWLAFFALPVARLALEGGDFLAVIGDPRHLNSLAVTTLLAAAVTLATLLVAGIAACSLHAAAFPAVRCWSPP